MRQDRVWALDARSKVTDHLATRPALLPDDHWPRHRGREAHVLVIDVLADELTPVRVRPADGLRAQGAHLGHGRVHVRDLLGGAVNVSSIGTPHLHRRIKAHGAEVGPTVARDQLEERAWTGPDRRCFAACQVHAVQVRVEITWHGCQQRVVVHPSNGRRERVEPRTGQRALDLQVRAEHVQLDAARIVIRRMVAAFQVTSERDGQQRAAAARAETHARDEALRVIGV